MFPDCSNTSESQSPIDFTPASINVDPTLTTISYNRYDSNRDYRLFYQWHLISMEPYADSQGLFPFIDGSDFTRPYNLSFVTFHFGNYYSS